MPLATIAHYGQHQGREGNKIVAIVRNDGHSKALHAITALPKQATELMTKIKAHVGVKETVNDALAGSYLFVPPHPLAAPRHPPCGTPAPDPA